MLFEPITINGTNYNTALNINFQVIDNIYTKLLELLIKPFEATSDLELTSLKLFNSTTDGNNLSTIFTNQDGKLHCSTINNIVIYNHNKSYYCANNQEWTNIQDNHTTFRTEMENLITTIGIWDDTNPTYNFKTIKDSLIGRQQNITNYLNSMSTSVTTGIEEINADKNRLINDYNTVATDQFETYETCEADAYKMYDTTWIANSSASIITNDTDHTEKIKGYFHFHQVHEKSWGTEYYTNFSGYGRLGVIIAYLPGGSYSNSRYSGCEVSVYHPSQCDLGFLDVTIQEASYQVMPNQLPNIQYDSEHLYRFHNFSHSFAGTTEYGHGYSVKVHKGTYYGIGLLKERS